MNIKNAIEIIEKLVTQTNNKRELKVYKKFIAILDNLKNRELSAAQVLEIEDELKTLDLSSNPENKRRYYYKKLSTFKQFLKDEFSFVSKGYYTAIGMSVGMCLGLAFGTSFGASGTSSGLVIGMAVGMVIGRLKDQEAEKQNRVLN
ncbi:hypothetical protein [Maribacter sp. HTCC2170]|uniref:hypothetical protein n=1 Tax=Maribacter sp. (strain HTCC2170 / KCCM 42371) TaxID=313603 RepID=UPI00006AFD95|nr:hypothetical protein [Maribacter sp. HTCC2170]EAR01245.1 hypothetical protein FB2170_11011 [Maribacter sp. HTCC2170]